MVSGPQRRIRRLKLDASNDDDVRRGALILEDAFHVASLPEVGGRVLILRSLNVGRFRNHYSSATMALTIEERIRQMLSGAVHAEDPFASSSPVVYFQNAAEPYLWLASRLARRARVDHWFWRLAVPEWHPTMQVDEALSRLIIVVVDQEGGVAIAAAIVRKLAEEGSIPSLVSALRWQDGVALLRASGWRRPELPSFLVESHAEQSQQSSSASFRDSYAESFVSSRWLPGLTRAVAEWGPDDPRTIWLVAIALVAEKPSRLHDAHLPIKAQQLIRTLMERSDSGRRRISAGEAAESAVVDIPPPADSVLSATGVAESSAATPDTPALRDEEERHDSFEVSRANGSARVSDQEVALPGTDAEDQRPAEPERNLYANPTAFAGLFFLIPLMARLGIASVLEANPDLIEWDLAERLLEHAGRLLRIDKNDAVLLAGNVREKEAPADCSFTAPRMWVESLSAGRGFAIARVRGSNRGRVLFDGSARLPLALWRGRATGEIRALVADGSLRRLRSLEDDGQVILSGWTNAMRRYLRRHARIGLGELVRRPGRVSVTRTHIDVVLNNDHADPRIRRAGLDLNPGWVPWLGRVVSFHYRYGGI